MVSNSVFPGLAEVRPAPLPSTPGDQQNIPGKDHPTIRQLLPYYLTYAEHEWRLAKQSLEAYQEGILSALSILGDITPKDLDREKVLVLKAALAGRNVGPARIRGVINALRSFLRFCTLGLGMEVLDPKFIRPPRVPKREVIFLTPEEVEKFVSAIPVYSGSRIDLRALGFRSLVEVLLGTGMRISEALSLKRSAVSFETGEARIIGKRNKERTVFFTPRALGWVKECVNHRKDTSEWLFVLPNGRRPVYWTIQKWFRQTRTRAGLLKKVTPHILRHTMATTLLFNGCHIGHIKELLGHDNLETTCQYYLGVDKKAMKEAHRKYLNF